MPTVATAAAKKLKTSRDSLRHGPNIACHASARGRKTAYTRSNYVMAVIAFSHVARPLRTSFAALTLAPGFQTRAKMKSRVSARLKSTQRHRFTELAGVRVRISAGTGRQVWSAFVTVEVPWLSNFTRSDEGEVEMYPPAREDLSSLKAVWSCSHPDVRHFAAKWGAKGTEDTMRQAFQGLP
jgi:hypothetical protein